MRDHGLRKPPTLRTFNSDGEVVNHLLEAHNNYLLRENDVWELVKRQEPFLIGTPSKIPRAKVQQVQQSQESTRYTPTRTLRDLPTHNERIRGSSLDDIIRSKTPTDFSLVVEELDAQFSESRPSVYVPIQGAYHMHRSNKRGALIKQGVAQLHYRTRQNPDTKHAYDDLLASSRVNTLTQAAVGGVLRYGSPIAAVGVAAISGLSGEGSLIAPAAGFGTAGWAFGTYLRNDLMHKLTHQATYEALGRDVAHEKLSTPLLIAPAPEKHVTRVNEIYAQRTAE